MIKFLLFYSHKPHLYYKSKLVYSKEILSCNIKGILEYGVLPHPLFSLGGGGGYKNGWEEREWKEIAERI